MEQDHREIERLIFNLNHKKKSVRLASLLQLKKKTDSGKIPFPAQNDLVNNHIHTFYSFSPYSPSGAVWHAFGAGLKTAGIVDHDTVAGAAEFIRAGTILGIATTVGFELRVDFSGTALAGRKINNPDQANIAYVAVHGLPHQNIGAVKKYLAPLRRARELRNSLMTEKLNAVIEPLGLSLDYMNDVHPLSMASEGGSVTERHILFALVRKLTLTFGRGGPLLEFLITKLQVPVPEKQRAFLSDAVNVFYDYDLLGVLKSGLVGRFYVDAAEECPRAGEFVGFVKKMGAIPAYAYLGDILESTTGDKQSQKFEDDYLDELFRVIAAQGFRAVTYMPSRNVPAQLERVKALCSHYGLLEISGEDINTPRQSFICPALHDPAFRNLIDTTWAIIGHEKRASKNIRRGFFSQAAETEHPGLPERIDAFMKTGKGNQPRIRKRD
jgi:hypothetical protein